MSSALKKTSRLTEKYQATIPLEIRKILKLGKGDQILFEVISDSDEIKIRKASPIDLEWLASLESQMGEWNSAADDEAYRDL